MVIWFSIITFFVVLFIFFLVTARTLSNLAIVLNRLEYLLMREYDLLKRQAVKEKLYSQNFDEDKKEKVPNQ